MKAQPARAVVVVAICASLVAASVSSSTASEVVTVSDDTAVYWIPVASHAEGAQGSQWRTDLGILNVGSGTANAELRLHTESGILTHAATVAAGEQVILVDVLGVFPYSGSAAMEIRSDRHLHVTARIYNQGASGTFGQGFDGFAPETGLAADEVVLLPQLTENASYRANVALTNIGGSDAQVRVELYDGDGVEVTRYTVRLAPGEWKQENRPFFNRAGRNDIERGYARVSVLSGEAVLPLASVVDNLTNDPTTIPMKRIPGSDQLRTWIAVVSHAEGAQSSQWRTDLGLLNTSAGTAEVELHLYDGDTVLVTELTIPPLAQVIQGDVLDLFAFTGSRALGIVSTEPPA